MSLRERIEAAITEATGEKARFTKSRSAVGGSINDSRIVSLKDGRSYFIKTNPNAKSCPGMFACEFEALALLADSGSIRVPQPVAYDEEFIVLETYAERNKGSALYEQLG